MSDVNKPKRLHRAGLWAVAAAALVGGAAIAEQVVVKSKSVAIQPTPSGMGSPVDTVKANDKLEILDRQGSWLKVRTPGGKEGFVKEGAIGSQAFASGTGVLRGDAASTGLNASEAGKGELGVPAKTFASRNNVDPRVIEHVLRVRNQITPEEFDQFLRDGKLGRYAGKGN